MTTKLHITAQVLHAFILMLLLTPLLYASFTFATSTFIQDTAGYDISYPQCHRKLPDSAAFVIIGVNGGRPFTENQCFKSQLTWAQKINTTISVYHNLSYITLRTAQYTFDGPKTCPDNNAQCLGYNQGYQLAKYAVETAKSEGASPVMWWLDIETMNTWSQNTDENVAIIQGAIDFHIEQKNILGIYSTKRQWRIIAGDFSPGLPVWIAGARDKNDAMSRCTQEYAFAGGKPHMVQYIKDNLDHNILCP